MSTVLHEVGTLADLQQIGNQALQYFARGAVVQVVGMNLEQIALYLRDQCDAVEGFVVVRQIEIGVGEQIDWRPRRNRTDAQESVPGERLEFSRKIRCGNLDVALRRGARDGTETGSLLGPKQFRDGVVKGLHPASDRGIASVRTQGVVMQQWRRRPDADERGHTVITRTAAGQAELAGRAIERMLHLDFTGRRQSLVGLR